MNPIEYERDKIMLLQSPQKFNKSCAHVHRLNSLPVSAPDPTRLQTVFALSLCLGANFRALALVYREFAETCERFRELCKNRAYRHEREPKKIDEG